MKKTRLIAAAVLLAAAVAVKLLLPDVAAAVRQTALAAFPDDTDYWAAFEDVSELFSPAHDDVPEAKTKVPAEEAAMSPVVLARHTAYHVEEAATLGEAVPAEAEPAAVAVFLESQAAFSDYALPVNVDYSYLKLPFEFSAPVAGYTSSGFGYRLHPILNYVRFHFGTDVAANAGEEVLAFAGGIVTFAGPSADYGNYIVIDHGDGWTTLYAHCSTLFTEAGRSVTAGENIALVGSTGLATGPHLHFELRRDGVYYNPEYYINA